jgi:hypothetical protein
MIGIVFVRNLFAVVILFAVTPWTKDMGLQNVCIMTAVFCFAILLLPIPLIVWGKKIRIATAKRYKRMAMRQPAHRTFE